MEAEVINSFLPDLVTAVSDTVQSVSDQCLAKGLIPGNVHDQVLESGGTSKEKARTLILAVKKSTETDSRCLEILLNILEQELPFAIRDNLLSKIRKELTEKANTCRAVVPLSKAVKQVPPEELSKETTLQQSFLLGRFEDSIRQHEHACAEKKLLTENLKAKSEKCERLQKELETLKGQNLELARKTQSRIAACTNKIESLEKRIEELQKTIEEQGMQTRRGKTTIITEIQRKEEEHKALIRELQSEATASVAREKSKVKSEQEKELTSTSLLQSTVEKPPDILEEHHLGPLCKNLTILSRQIDAKIEYYEQLALNWNTFAIHLGFSIRELPDSSSLNKEYHIIVIITSWLQCYPGDERGSTTYPTYSRLKQALLKADLQEVAEKLISYEELSKYELL